MELTSHVIDNHHHHHHQHQHQLIMHKPTKRREKPFSLETYLSYLHSLDFSLFTVAHLNLVISIHGYRRFKHRKSAEEAMRGIEPTHPARSTLNEENSSSPYKANITFEEALKDLKALNWQECSITSMRSIKQDNHSTDLVTVPPCTAIAKSKFQKAAKKRKTGSLMSNDCLPSKITPLMSASSVPSKSDGSSTYSIVPVFPMKFTSKKRSQREVKRLMLSSSTSCTSGPSNSSNSEGCVVSLAAI